MTIIILGYKFQVTLRKLETFTVAIDTAATKTDVLEITTSAHFAEIKAQAQALRAERAAQG